jgi:pyridinium-3,5-bisthiocarboxylic acid mononucleotide nickel chelatase
MKIIYFDCIAGDMILGALIDLGLDIHQLEKELAKLSLPGYHINTKRVKKQAVQAMQFQVLLHMAYRHRCEYSALSHPRSRHSGFPDDYRPRLRRAKDARPKAQ